MLQSGTNLLELLGRRCNWLLALVAALIQKGCVWTAYTRRW